MLIRILMMVHVFGVVLVFSGVIAGWAWMREAAMAGDAKLTTFALNGMSRLNSGTLYLGATLVLVSGFWMALAAPAPLKLGANPWLLYSVILFFVVLFLAMGAQLPIARKVMALAERNDPHFPVILSKIASRWSMLSATNLILLVIILFLMVFKP